MISLPFLPLVRLARAAGRRTERTRQASRLARLAAHGPGQVMYLERLLAPMDSTVLHALRRDATAPEPDDPGPD
ncbi:hypothetical protein RKE29_15490 [Streptomyces sp. B1866]|uniref:hypothetical protein n=1 Tax=Streptomyces sp. B1866 TaxID=3075431 RepID=UPI00288D15C7|nr:hypothetical protein [Streptomyces sp. B1866]MDT3398027.1 hypothetical protein [Streptomyces sp. B1866]